jgi:hypothetical protein
MQVIMSVKHVQHIVPHASMLQSAMSVPKDTTSVHLIMNVTAVQLIALCA